MRKPFRALLPWWAASAGLLMLSWLLRKTDVGHVLDDGTYELMGIWAYVIGSVVLGAMAIGHEYTHNTLSTWLLQPVGRIRLLVSKAVPLAVSLAGLAVIAMVCLGFHPFQGGLRAATIGWLPLLCGFCLAPWLTMIARNPLAGAVYSLLVPVLFFVVGRFLKIPVTAAPLIIVVLACVALLLTTFTFLRLEVAGAPQAEVDLLGWVGSARPRRAPSQRRHAVWALMTKELRLQQVTLVMGAGYVFVWVLIGVAKSWMSETEMDNLRYAATFIFGALASLLPGALVSAEERRFGTADWHALLPTRPGVQWGVKLGVALSLAVGLAVGLPALLDAISPNTALEEGFHPALALLLCLSAVYVSSLTSNGLHALLATPPALGAAFATSITLIAVSLWLATPLLLMVANAMKSLLPLDREQIRMLNQLRDWVPLATTCVLLAHFAARNHASADRSRSRIYPQVGWIMATALGSAFFFFVVQTMRVTTSR